MKSLLSFILLLQLTVSISQQLPNNNFEDWSQPLTWHEPTPMSTGNFLTYLNSQDFVVIRTDQSHGGNFAAKLVTAGDDTEGFYPGALALGPLGYADDAPIAFNSRPDSIAIWTNYNISAGDFGGLLLELNLNGTTIGSAYSEISGTSGGYIRLAIAIDYLNLSVPNELSLLITNSNFQVPSLESVLYVDDIELIYINEPGEQIPNGDLEFWEENSVPSLTGWQNSNFLTYPEVGVSPDENAYEGNYSARIENVYSVLAEDYISYIYLGDIYNENCDDNSLVMDNDQVPTSVSGYYKYECENPEDSASVYVFARYLAPKAFDCDSLFEWVYYLPVASDWTAFTVNIPELVLAEWALNQIPSHFTVAFVPGEVPQLNEDNIESTPGAVLWLDAASVQTETIIKTDEVSRKELDIYPNPADQFLSIQNNNAKQIDLMEIIDLTGKIAMTISNPQNQVTIDTSSLRSGYYFLKTQTQDKTSHTRFIISH